MLVTLYDLPHTIVQVTRDPTVHDRVAAASADGALVVVRGVAIEWQSDFDVADLFSAVEAIVWCGAFLIACGSRGGLQFFKPGPANRSSPCAYLPITGTAAVGADSYIQRKAVVQCVAASSKLIVCAAGRTISLMTVNTNFRINEPSLGRLISLSPLPIAVVALSLIPDFLVAATLGRGCVLWRGPLTLGTAASPDIVLRCGSACAGIYAFKHTVITPCSDFTVRFWKEHDENCFTLGGLCDRVPKCCTARYSSLNQDSIVLAISDGSSGVLLWPLDEKSAPSESLGLDSRRARRLLNESCNVKAINVAAVAASVFVFYDNGSLNIFLLSIDARGLSATLTNAYAPLVKWRGANLSPPTDIEHQNHEVFYATRADSPIKTLIAYLAP
jgi:hypothetical protein